MVLVYALVIVSDLSNILYYCGYSINDDIIITNDFNKAACYLNIEMAHEANFHLGNRFIVATHVYHFQE